MISNRTILISPLDWGFGHATRCVPIIQALSKDNNVIIGVTPLNGFFFDRYFPTLGKIMLPSYNIRYSKILPVWLKLLLQAPKINSVTRKENKLLEKIISEHNIDLVISDNRFGLSSPKVECIFITHQLQIKAPFLSGIANRINKKYIHRFGRVWVPDYEDEGQRLSGLLSDSRQIKIPVEYIGPKSHLQLFEKKIATTEVIDYLVLLSGVEPQRSELENLLITELNGTNKKVVFVRGSNLPVKNIYNHIRMIDFAFDEELKSLVVNAGTVICRSGYSTLMDLHLLHKHTIILIPTPGQTEQEYLAEHWHKKFSGKLVYQNNIKGSILK